VGVGGLRCQGDIREGSDVVYVHINIRVCRFRACLETINVQFGIPGLNGSDHTENLAFRQSGGQNAVHISALFRAGLIGKDVIDPLVFKGIHRRPPGKGGVGEVGRDLLQRRPILGTVGDHQIIALRGIIPDGRCGVINDEHAFRVIQGHSLFAAHLFLHQDQRIVHALAECQVIDRAGHDQGDPEGFFFHSLRGLLFHGLGRRRFFRGGRLTGCQHENGHHQNAQNFPKVFLPHLYSSILIETS